MRCRKCNKLLFKSKSVDGKIEIVCPKCKTINTFYFSKK